MAQVSEDLQWEGLVVGVCVWGEAVHVPVIQEAEEVKQDPRVRWNLQRPHS